METEVDASVPVLAPTTPAPQTSTISDFNYVDNGDGTLTVTNAGTELPLRNIRIEDKIHEGLTVRQDAITVACEELGLDKAPLSQTTAVSARVADGKLLVEVGTLPVGATMKVFVPTALTSDLVRTTRFENTAAITSVEGHDLDEPIKSETTYHMARKTYGLTYEVAADPTYGTLEGVTPPSPVTGIEYDTDQRLAHTLSSDQAFALRDGQQVRGFWRFDGWLPTASAGEAVTSVNVRQDATVYGRWAFVPTTDLTVTKVWEGPKKDAAEVVLLRDGTEIEKATLDEAGAWTHEFTDLVAYDSSDGHEYHYSVKETPIGGYVSAVTGSMGDGYTITNTYKPEPTRHDPPVEKRVDGPAPKTPDSFEFVLTPNDPANPDAPGLRGRQEDGRHPWSGLG